VLIVVEKIFTRKLHVPAKHITLLAEPCDAIPELTQKHLFLALLKIIQCDVYEKGNSINETIRMVEKSAAGSDVILQAITFWLRDMDPKSVVEEWDEVACGLIDWAIITRTCREEMEFDQEKLKGLKGEYTTKVKQLRLGNWSEMMR
jgi:hypothetical protein